MSVIKKVDDFLSRAARIITATAILLQMVIVFVGVVMRYFVKTPLIWGDELAAYMLVFVTFFGSYVALKDKALARITLAIVKLPHTLRRIVVLAANLSTVFLLLVVAYFSIQLCSSPIIQKTLSPAMQVPTVLFYLIMPISSGMMLIHMLVAIYEDLHDKYEHDEQEVDFTC